MARLPATERRNDREPLHADGGAIVLQSAARERSPYPKRPNLRTSWAFVAPICAVGLPCGP
jgi:hypothetical protein